MNRPLACLLACAALAPAAASAHDYYTPPYYQHSRPDLPIQHPTAFDVKPDLEFVCGNAGPAACIPVSSRYKRYMRLANWRLDHVLSGPGTCVLNATYGYGKDAVWTRGGCVGAFRAPDLRYGDSYNAQRLAHARAVVWVP